MNAVAYLRVSTQEQADSGLSLANQREKVETLAKLHDWTLTAVREDAGASGKDTNRPGLQEVLSLVRSRKVEAVIVLKLDRLTRSQQDLFSLLSTFKRYGVRLVSVHESLDTDSAAGRFFLSMLGAIAEWERDTISERTASAIGQLRRNGKRFSRIAPYGWEYDLEGGMIPVEAEQEVIDLIKTFAVEKLSLRGIARALEERGYHPRTGKAWHPSLIGKILREAA
ncbi:MAG: hypothetical protein GHCLOJNM_03236 [bacterium]|nr:hypothetical protein [bacterium]